MHAAYFTTICKRFCHISTLLSKAKPSIFCRNITNFPVKPIDFDSIEPSSEEVSTGHFFSILKECDSPDDLQKGRIVHAQIIVNGIDDMGLLSTRVLGMYVLCGSITDAKNLFFRLERGVPLPWNWLIRGFTMMGLFEFALLFYFKMFFSGVWPDRYTFRYVIKACCGLSAVGLGRLVHETIRVMGLELDIFVGSSLIKMYTDNGSIVEAREVFDQLPDRDCVLWNVMVHGYVKKGDMRKTIELFNRMSNSNEKPNYVTFSCVLSICASEAIVGCGTQLHGLTIKYGLEFVPSVANTLLAMYTKCRCWSDACKFFDMMPQTDLVTWNGLISGYVQNGMKEEALDSFYKMQSVGVKPDSVTLASILPSFSASARLKQGKEIHAYIVRNDVCLDAFLKSALIDIYFKCKDVDMACRIFHATELMDVVICSAMISGFVLNGMSSNALDMFRLLLQVQMRPNAITVTSVLPACSCLTTLRLGKELHCYALKNAFEGRCYVGSALIDMYAKCGRLDLGHQIFVKLSERDAVAWNSMIVSFTQNGQPQVAINLFRQMGLEGLRYDCATISTILSACASIPALQYGKVIHGFMMRGAFKSDVYAESALIDMYAKCGGLVFARRIFDSMQEKNEVSWNSIIAAYGTYGNVKDAAILFKEMNEAGFQPDHITFLTLISACGHAGNVEEGFRYFRRMNEEYGIVAHMEHYACMVDLFGRAGRLDEALCIIRSMPIEPDAGIWGAMLGACRVHGNVELAELASKHLFELDPQNSGYYVLLSHINAGSGHWERVLKVRSLMKERKVQKLPGCSWIEISNTSHMFIAADQSHPDSTLIYLLLKKLLLELREEGYVPQVDLTYPPPMDSHKQLLKI